MVQPESLLYSLTVKNLNLLRKRSPLSTCSDLWKNKQTTNPILSWLTLLFRVVASGSVIQAPNRVPDVFIVTGPVIFINFPHAVDTEKQH